MDKLPSEIQDIIWNYYWQDIYSNKVLPCTLEPCRLDLEIKLFLNRYCFRINFFNNTYLFYLIKYNNKIKEFINQYNKLYDSELICKHNNLSLQYCLNIDEMYECIHDDLKYICVYSIVINRDSRFKTLHKFKELSLLV